MVEHTTNYFDTFITIAPDSAAVEAVVPPQRATPSVAERTYRLIAERPYELTSDDVLFTVWADRNDISEADRPAARERFFSKGQACLRSSDLAKRYGWGVHSDSEGRVAIIGVDTPEYAAFVADDALTVVPAMRSSRK